MRRGTALLLVLIGIAALSVATIAIATNTTSRVRLLALDRLEDQCDVLRADAEYAAGVWLREHGTTLTTPIAEPYRPTTIIDSAIVSNEQQVHIFVQAWDALSSIPQPSPGSPIPLPPDIHVSESAEPELWWLCAASDARSRFPRWENFTATHDSAQELPPLALACSVLSGQRVNWRTAPWEVVTALIPTARQGDLPGLLRNGRESGKAVLLPDDARRTTPPYLIDTTDRWYLNLQIQIGDQCKQWFLVVARQDGGMTTVVRYALR